MIKYLNRFKTNKMIITTCKNKKIKFVKLKLKKNSMDKFCKQVFKKISVERNVFKCDRKHTWVSNLQSLKSQRT